MIVYISEKESFLDFDEYELTKLSLSMRPLLVQLLQTIMLNDIHIRVLYRINVYCKTQFDNSYDTDS